MTRSLGGAVVALIAALAIALASSISSSAPASASTSTASAMTDAYTSPPSPLIAVITPLAVGIHVIEAIAEGIANAVEYIATPPPVTIPAPRAST